MPSGVFFCFSASSFVASSVGIKLWVNLLARIEPAAPPRKPITAPTAVPNPGHTAVPIAAPTFVPTAVPTARPRVHPIPSATDLTPVWKVCVIAEPIPPFWYAEIILGESINIPNKANVLPSLRPCFNKPVIPGLTAAGAFTAFSISAAFLAILS